MSVDPATQSSKRRAGTLGTGRDVRRRLLLHHVPLALASAVVLVLFMGLPAFDADARPHADVTSGPFPQQRAERDGMEMDHGGERTRSERHGGDQADPMDMDHVGNRTRSSDHGGDQAGPMDMDHGEEQAAGFTLDFGEPGSRAFMSQLTVATGYVATVLLALTLLIGPANLLLRRRNPVSSYLRRDAGTWTAIASVVHVILALQMEFRGRISDFLNYFVAPDGSPLTNSFGWGNWTGLAATVIVVGLLAMSTDGSLRELKATRWKNLQRLNYALFALVVAHAFFYGALVRVTSPFALVLLITVIAVFVGQAVGIWLWRRRHPRTPASERERQPAGAAR